MDARVAQFHSDATEIRKAGAKPKAAKEIKKLQKFLHNNQDYRFTERAKSHLFSAIEVCMGASDKLCVGRPSCC